MITNLRPVLVDLTYEQVSLDDFSVTFLIKARKQLDCHALLGTEQGYALLDDEYWEKVEFSFDEVSSGNRFPVLKEKGELQSFGKWLWVGNIYQVSKVKITIDSLCNYTMVETSIHGVPTREVYGDKRTIHIGPFEIERKEISESKEREQEEREKL